MLIPEHTPPQTNDETLEIPKRLFSILQSCASENKDGHRFPPTEVFNEGWMLRLVLDVLQTVDVPGHPLNFLDGATWYSEARLSTPFHPTTKRDPLGEGFTKADAVIGDVDFRGNTKAGLRLPQGARQFIVVEAKMFSNLSSGTTNAPGYDQAARNVACMAATIMESKIPLDALKSVGFFVVAPNLKMRQQRKPNTNLEACLEPDAIRSAVKKRIEGYARASRDHDVLRLTQWEEQVVHLVDRLKQTDRLRVLDWKKEIIQPIADLDDPTGEELFRFYDRCLEYA